MDTKRKVISQASRALTNMGIYRQMDRHRQQGNLISILTKISGRDSQADSRLRLSHKSQQPIKQENTEATS
jgi:hypothetical protein